MKIDTIIKFINKVRNYINQLSFFNKLIYGNILLIILIILYFKNKTFFDNLSWFLIKISLIIFGICILYMIFYHIFGKGISNLIQDICDFFGISYFDLNNQNVNNVQTEKEESFFINIKKIENILIEKDELNLVRNLIIIFKIYIGFLETIVLLFGFLINSILSLLILFFKVLEKIILYFKKTDKLNIIIHLLIINLILLLIIFIKI